MKKKTESVKYNNMEIEIEDMLKLSLDMQWLLTGNMFIEIKKKKRKKKNE